MNEDIVRASKFLIEQIDNFAKELCNEKSNHRFVKMAIENTKQPSFNGIPFKDTIVRELHNHGINMRYLGLLALKIDKNTQPKMISFLVSLMVTRAMKNIWRKNIQQESSSNHVHEVCLYQTIHILNSFLMAVTTETDKNSEQQGINFWNNEICSTMVDMFAKGLTNDYGEIKEMFINFSKDKLEISWIIIRFCQLCGIVLTHNAIQSLHSGYSFKFSRADVIDFMVNIKFPPILHYFTGIHYFKKAQTEKILGTKLSLMKASSERLLNAIDFNFPNVREYYAESLFFSQKFDRKFVGDWYMIEQHYDKIWKQISKNVNTDITQEYLDCLCSILWPEFLKLPILFEEIFVPIEIKQDPSKYVTIERLKEVISKSQKDEIILCITNFTKKIEEIEKKFEESINGLTSIKFNLNDTNSDIMKNLINEIKDWDVDIEGKWWFFAHYFSSFQDVVKFCHSNDIKLKDRNSEESIVAPYSHLLSLFYYGDMELEQMLDNINDSDIKLSQILNLLDNDGISPLAIANGKGYQDVVDLLIKRGVHKSKSFVICDRLEQILSCCYKGASMNITMRELDLFDNQIGDEGANFLSSVLMSNNTLTSLNLRGNLVRDEGAYYLSSALMSNNTLTSLNLSRNFIRDEGANYLSSALMSNNTLTSLDLRDNYIGEEKYKEISQLHSKRVKF